MIKFILGVIIGSGAWAFICNPAGKAVLSAIVYNLEATQGIVTTAALPVLSDDTAAPPMSGGTLPSAVEEVPVPVAPAAGEAESESAVYGALDVYNKDNEAPAGESRL